MEKKFTLNQIVWLSLFALIAITMLLQLDSILHQLRKNRVMIFEARAGENVIEGDFKDIPVNVTGMLHPDIVKQEMPENPE